MTDNLTVSAVPANARASRRPRALIVLVALAIAGAIGITFSDIEGNFKGPLILLIALLLMLAMALWVVAFSRMSRGRRWKIVLGGVLALVAIGVAAPRLLRREGSFTGAGFPRFVWRWSPHDVAPPLEPIIQKVAAIGPGPAGPDDFPQFLGPHRDSRLPDVHLSRDWASNPPRELWRKKVGAGWSGFAVVGKYAITMEQRGENETTICCDLETGRPVWSHGNPQYLHEPEGGDGPRATPTVADGRIYTLGGLGHLDCLDGATGNAIWSRELFTAADQRLHYGQTSSPLVVDDKVIVGGGAKGPSLLAFDKVTGNLLWHCDGDLPSYASPDVATVAGVRQILLVHQHGIAGHDLADGHVLWEFKWPGFLPKNSQAVAVGPDRVYCSTGYSIGSVLLQISQAASPGNLQVAQLWHSPLMKTELSNVIMRDGYVLGLDDGRLLCQDVSNGKKKWKGENYGHGQMLQAGEVLLIQGEDGQVSLVDATPNGATALGSIAALSTKLCWNTMALSGHLMLVRNSQEAACYRLP